VKLFVKTAATDGRYDMAKRFKKNTQKNTPAKEIFNFFKYAESILIGVRFSPDFSYSDKYGEIIDSVTNNTKCFKDLYKKVKKDQYKVKLFGDIENNSLHNFTLTSSDVVVEDVIETNFNSAIENKKTQFNAVVKQIFSKYNISKINRVGIATKFVIDDISIIKVIMSNVFKIPDVQSARFTKTSKPPKSKINNETGNFYNTIYDIRLVNNKLEIAIDFQHMITPALSSISTFNIDVYLKDYKESINNDMIRWLKDEK